MKIVKFMIKLTHFMQMNKLSDNWQQISRFTNDDLADRTKFENPPFIHISKYEWNFPQCRATYFKPQSL